MKQMTTEEMLKTRLETLKNDFRLSFGDTEETELFLRVLKDMGKAKADAELRDNTLIRNRFLRLLTVVKRRFYSYTEELDDFSSILIQVMVLERILAEEKMKGRGNGTVDEFFLDSQMFERIESVSEYAKTVRAMGLENADRESLGWGVSSSGNGSFSKGAPFLVEKYSKLLENSSRLKALAEKIGRHSVSKIGKIKSENVKPSVSYDGIYNSDNIRTILPSELALSADERTRTEFLRRLADRQVLCYKPAPDRSAADGNSKDKGAVIICLDTSGSMHGAPEALSKAMVLNILKYAAAEKRNMIIISFSVTFEMLKIIHPEKACEMEKIISFLSSSFHGGTDIASAIEQAVSLSERELKSADVLIVSDFVSQNLSKSTERKILSAKRKGSRFFALSIGNRGNNQILKLMSESEIISNGFDGLNLEF